MTAQHPPWTPDTERAFKEVLYRFMGDVHATKAALYLKSSSGGWSLATQYGFGRRDRLSESFADDHPLVRMVRAFGEDPRFYNDLNEVGELAGYLADAGTTRLMLVPVIDGTDQVGFIDVRDKGGQRPFVAGDLELSRSIAVGLTRLIRDTAPDESAKEPRVEGTVVAAPKVVELPADSGDGSEALLDEPGFDEINTAAADGLADPRVLAIALSIASPAAAAILVHQRAGSPGIELDPLIKHQIDAMTEKSVSPPPPKAWKTEIRRTAGPAGSFRSPVIGSAVLLRVAGSCLVASVIADAEPAVAREAVERLGTQVAEARERFCLRIARRGLARRLLQPGDRRYPELVAHSLGVSRLCWSIARVLEFDETATEHAALAGLLHDVGMRELDYDRLYMHPTPGPEDRRTYRMHVEVGDRIVRVEGFDEIADAVRHHHERWDGNGYPDRLANTAIPVLARIVHVAEVFDLFTAANSYRPAVSQERALAILKRAAGHQFDPAVVDAITKVVA